jgi:hypothetical protein
MADLFDQLNELDGFRAYVQNAKATFPGDLAAQFDIANQLSDERIELAYQKYQYEIARFSTYLHSKNPDHYKRSGALLQALCTNPVILSTSGWDKIDDVETGFTRMDYAAAQEIVEVGKFYEEYKNEFVALDLAFRACLHYEPNIKTIDFDLIHNICHYLQCNPTLPGAAYFILFKTLMA